MYSKEYLVEWAKHMPPSTTYADFVKAALTGLAIELRASPSKLVFDEDIKALSLGNKPTSPDAVAAYDLVMKTMPSEQEFLGVVGALFGTPGSMSVRTPGDENLVGTPGPEPITPIASSSGLKVPSTTLK